MSVEGKGEVTEESCSGDLSVLQTVGRSVWKEETMKGREGDSGRYLGAGRCGINSSSGGICSPLHLSRKKRTFSEQECHRRMKFKEAQIRWHQSSL